MNVDLIELGPGRQSGQAHDRQLHDCRMPCILVADSFVTERLRVITSTEDGFEIAEDDLRIRGPGEFLGTRQSGLPGFRVGHILRDASLLNLAQKEAATILQEDPNLDQPSHSGIQKMVESRWREKLDRLTC